MEARIKKQNEDGIVRIETSGEIKEIIIKEDLLKKNKTKFSLCFKGKRSSGIIDLSRSEIKMLLKELEKESKFSKNVKVMEFKK